MLATGRRRLLASAIVVLVLVAGAAAYVVTRPSALASGTATLTIFRGAVTLKAAGAAASHNGVTGELLGQGEQVTTAADTWAAINFPDGSITRMDSNTQVSITTLTQPTGGGWNIQLSEAVGKTWNRVAQLVGSSSFSVTGPNQTNAEVRGTDFEVLVILQPDGNYQVRINNFSGAITVFVGNNGTPVGPNQSTTVTKGATSATPPGPIPAGDLNDPFTVFNQTINSQTGGVTATVAVGFLDAPNSSGIQPGVAVDGNTDADFGLGWPGSTYTLRVYKPDGTPYQETKSAKPPLHLVVPRGEAGNWTYEVIDNESKPHEPWVVVINTIRPSTQTPKPFFVVPPPTKPDEPPCAHGVTAGQTDSWKVTARDAAGKPAITASGLPSWGSFTDNGNGTGTVTFNPPSDTPDQVIHPTFTASLLGLSDTLTECTESVAALGKASSVGGTVSGGPGAGVTLSLDPGGAVAVTGSGGGYGFTGLGAGTYTVTLTVPSGYTASGATSVTRTVDGTNSAVANFALTKNAPAAPAAPTLSSNTLPAATFGGLYTYQFAATGGAGPYTFSKVSGLMPPGLMLSSSGLLSGSVDPNATPVASATSPAPAHFMALGLSPVPYTFGVVAVGANGQPSPPFSATVTVNPQPTITFTPTMSPTTAITQTGTPPPNGFVILTPPGDMTVPYSQSFGVLGGTAPYTWSISSGSPAPFGLSLSPTGVLSGTPTAPANEGLIAVRVTDATGAFADGEVDIDIFQAPTWALQLNPFDANGFVERDAGTSLFAGLGFTAGQAGVGQLLLASGSLPPCLQLRVSEGSFELDGFLDPTNLACVGTFGFSAKLTDPLGGYATSMTYTVQVNPPVVLAPATLPDATINQLYAPVSFSASGGHPGNTPSSFQISFSTFQLPAGMNVTGNGTSAPSLGGTPTASGDFPLDVVILDHGNGQSINTSVDLQVTDSTLRVTGGSLGPFADQNFPYVGSTFTAAGGRPPYTWSLRGAPVGMNIDPNTGAISGMPTANTPLGTYNVVALVTDSTIVSVPVPAQSPSFTVQVFAPPTVSVAPQTQCLPGICWPSGTVSANYASTNTLFTTSGGAGCCFLASGVTGLPAGMSLSYPCLPTCFLTGVPLYKGTYTVSVSGYDSINAHTNTVTGTFVVDPSPTGPVLTPAPNPLQPAALGLLYDSYCTCIAVTGTLGNPFDPAVHGSVYDWTSTPAPPAGMKFSDSGGNLVVSGTPTVASPPTVYTATATDAAGLQTSAKFTLQVEAGAPTLAAMPPGWDVGIPYTEPDGVTPVKLTSATGTAPINWALPSLNIIPVDVVCVSCFGFVFGGSLPAGLTLGTDGTISGTPTAAGTYTFAVQATDALGVPSFIDVQIAIADPALTIKAPANPISGQSYADTFGVTGGTHPYSWTLVSGAPPAGLTLDKFFHLTGMPTAPVGTSSTMTVKVTDLAGATATKTITLTVVAPPAAASPAASAKPASPASPSPSPSPSPTPSPSATP